MGLALKKLLICQKKKKEQKLAQEECMASTMLVCMEVAELKRQNKLSGSWGSAFGTGS